MDDLYKFDSRQLSDLLKNYFIICKNDVQRDFVWGVDISKKFLDDILNENGRFYGINSMGFSYVDESLHKIECYDGQQRLTTYVLLIISLRFFIDECININVEAGDKKKRFVLDMLKSLIVRPNIQTFDVEDLAFIPNDGNTDNINIYKNILKLEKNQDFNKYVAENNLNKNKYVKIINSFFQFFGEIFNDIDVYYEKLNNCYKKNNGSKNSEDKFLLSIVDSIINKPVIMIYIDSEEDKYMHFINQMKGEKLIPSQFFETQLNILKNKVEDDNIIEKIDDFLELFNKIKYVFDDNGNYEPNDNLLKYLIYYKTYKNHRVNNGLVDEIFMEYKNFNKISDIEYAINISEIYFDILNLKKGKDIIYLNKSNNDSYELLYEKLQVINNVLKIRDTFNPIIIMLFIKYGNDYEKICTYLDILIKFGFIHFKLYKTIGNVDIRPIVDEIIKYLKDNDSIDNFKKIIVNELDKLYKDTNSIYIDKINGLKNLTIFSTVNFNKNLIKFILLEYYKSQEDDDSEKLVFDDLSIEHIIPKKYEENYLYLDSLYSNKEEIEELINSMGNQLLLVLKANQKISNKSINEKNIIYKKSHFNENIYFANNLENNIEIQPKEIIDRHSKIIDFIGKYFEIQY